jgi:hypothetical protein
VARPCHCHCRRPGPSSTGQISLSGRRSAGAIGPRCHSVARAHYWGLTRTPELPVPRAPGRALPARACHTGRAARRGQRGRGMGAGGRSGWRRGLRLASGCDSDPAWCLHLSHGTPYLPVLRRPDTIKQSPTSLRLSPPDGTLPGGQPGPGLSLQSTRLRGPGKRDFSVTRDSDSPT